MGREIIEVVDDGLREWSQVPDARVDYLEDSARPGLRIPRIFVEASEGFSPGSPVVVFMGGMHLEETSGFRALSDPRIILPVIEPFRDRFSFLVYPIVNHHGTAFIDENGVLRPESRGLSRTVWETAARSNMQGINYNDTWGVGFTRDQKPDEVRLIEDDIREITANEAIAMAGFVHEDSTVSGKAYVWLNGRPLIRQARQIKAQIERGWKGQVVTSADYAENPQLEWDADGFAVIYDNDPGTAESHFNDMGAPTLTSEAPYQDALDVRLAFHQHALAAGLEATLE